MNVEVHAAQKGSQWVPAMKGLRGREVTAHNGFPHEVIATVVFCSKDSSLLLWAATGTVALAEIANA